MSGTSTSAERMVKENNYVSPLWSLTDSKRPDIRPLSLGNTTSKTLSRKLVRGISLSPASFLALPFDSCALSASFLTFSRMFPPPNNRRTLSRMHHCRNPSAVMWKPLHHSLWTVRERGYPTLLFFIVREIYFASLSSPGWGTGAGYIHFTPR